MSDVKKKVIQNLASKNNSGHDGISARFLKKILEIITPPLTHIINQSLCTGIFPYSLKIVKIIPLFKKVISMYLTIIVLYLYYLSYPRFLRKLSSTKYISISLIAISFTTASTF